MFGYKANGDARRTLHLQLPNEAETEVGEDAIVIHPHTHTHTHTHTLHVFLIFSRTREAVIGVESSIFPGLYLRVVCQENSLER